MAVTYADLVAFGFAYVEDNLSTNLKRQKLCVKKKTFPLLSSQEMCLCEEEDFIIFAEFSEVKGPVALFTVPSYVQHDDKVDVNSFIMRIMSVDYQANPGGQFSICQDTEILQTYVLAGRHAYVHYFTLYDLHARGFVRPLCIAYVSSNNNKLHRIFPQLRDQFLKITELIKVNNRQHFKNEISSVLTNLKTLQAGTGKNIEDGKQECLSSITSKLSIQHGQCIQQYDDFLFMLNVIEANLVNLEYTLIALDHWKNALMSKDDVPTPKEVQDYLSIVLSGSKWNRMNFNENICTLEKQLRPIPVLSPWGTACALSFLLDLLQNFGSCEMSIPLGSFPLSSVSQDHSLHDNLLQQEYLNAWVAMEKSEFLQLLEALSVGALDASIPTFIEEAGHDIGSSSSKETSGNEGSSSYHSLSDFASDDLPRAESSLSSSHQPSTGVLNGIAAPGSQERISLHDSFQTIHDESLSSLQSESRGDFHSIVESYSSYIQPNQSLASNVSKNSQPNCEPSSSSSNSSSSSESFHDILETFHSDDNWSIGSIEERLPLGIPWHHCLWTRHKPLKKSGHRLLKFFWTYRSAAQHIVYSLLTGRTLVLAGNSSSERRVQRIMSALSPLIPPIDNNGLRVLRWHQGILVSAHIASYQVIGMCIPERLSIHDMISPRDKNSVTILDVNTEQFFGPAYHGHLLAPVGNNVRDFPCDLSLLLYLESVLNGIGRKLKAYKVLVSASPSELPSHACRQLDTHGCDADMIKYLSKLSL